MFTDEQLKQLANVIDERLESKLAPITKQLSSQGRDIASLKNGQEALDHRMENLETKMDNLEMKVELVNERVANAEQSLKEAIHDSQHDTITVLSDMIHEGYNMHDARIQRLERKLNLPPLPTSVHGA